MRIVRPQAQYSYLCAGIHMERRPTMLLLLKYRILFYMMFLIIIRIDIIIRDQIIGAGLSP